MPRLLIAGCGYVGVATADLFYGLGWGVEGWTKSPESAAQLSAKPYSIRAIDLTEREALKSASDHFDAVIHCASSGGGGIESYRRVYLQGAQNLIEILRPETFIFTSSTSVYAQSSGELVDEESPAEPTTETGKVLRATEDLVRQANGTVARLAGIYGPGRSALLRKLVSGEARLENGGERYLNQVHRDDIASALLFLVSLPNEQRIGATFNITDNEPKTQRACYEWLARELSYPIPPTSTSEGERKRGASNKRVSNRKLRCVGWKLQFPTFEQGMIQSVLPAAAETKS